MKIQVSTLHASKKIILGSEDQHVEITSDDVARWNSRDETNETIETEKIKTSKLEIGDFTFEVQSGVFAIKHTSGKDWKFSPEN
jgi:hypothetical protein